MNEPDFDIIVHGATGFTGRLIAEYLLETAEAEGVRWAMAGRNLTKLEDLRTELGAADGLELIVADGHDEPALDELVRRTKLVIATAGPFSKFGTGLVGACAAHGTDYLDLCGEPHWISQMIERIGKTAFDSGARLVFSSGFDSIPSDLGVYLLQQEAIQRSGAPIRQVRGRVRSFSGTASGGTVATIGSSIEAAMADPEIAARLGDPFALTPGFTGPAQPSGDHVAFEADLDSWVAPFVMATINTKNVHRSNLLLGHRYGTDFEYSEMLLTGSGPDGEAAAQHLARTGGGIDLANDPPAAGEGPSAEERDAGHYVIDYLGETIDAEPITVTVTGHQDPGYGSTSKIITQTAYALLSEGQDAAPGATTPTAAMADALIGRLTSREVLDFSTSIGAS